MSLDNKSIHELRAIAQGYDIRDIFAKKPHELIQAIADKQEALAPKPVIEIPQPAYDGRLRMRPPSKSSSHDDILKLLEPFTAIGLRVTFPHPEQFHIAFGKKEDTGSIKQPLRVILGCAREVMR